MSGPDSPDVPRPNVVLTGFMGTGKSTVGRVLARQLGYRFVDTDAVIEHRYGPIPAIFADQGEAAFRRFEAELAAELAAESGLVIATGGKLMLDEANAAALEASGTVLCLVANPDTIVARVGGARAGESRPLLAGDDPARRVHELLEHRRAGYARFRAVVTDGRSPEEIADHIIAAELPPMDPPTSSAAPGR